MANLPRETHPVKTVGNISASVVQALSGQDQRNRLRHATVRLQTSAPQSAEEQTERLLCGSQR